VDASGNVNDMWYQVQTDGTLTGGVGHFFGGQPETPASSGFNAVAVDQATGNFYLTGPLHLAGNPQAFILVDGVGADGSTQLYAQGGGWLWNVSSGGVQLNWVSNDNVLDSNDGQLQATTFDDGSGGPGTHGLLGFTVTNAGNVYDAANFGDAGLSGSGDDYFQGIAHDPRLTSTNTYYWTGYTNSIDFGVTNNIPYPGGATAGWAASVHLG
jgi:hypothetical protein